MRTLTAIVPVVTVLLVMSACGSPEPAESMAPDTTRVEATTEDARQQDVLVADMRDGVQEVRILVRNDGYSPATIELQENVPARLIFVQESTSRCAEQVQIPAFGVDRTNLPVGEETVVEFTPDRAGEFAFVCGMEMLEGTLLVRT